MRINGRLDVIEIEGKEELRNTPWFMVWITG